MPAVSVIMNCYNGEAYLREAIDSVYAQQFGDWEIVFWDNGSKDASESIARSYSDGRLRYFRATTTTTLGAARALAMQQARGDWIGFLDVDDFWFPHKLSRQIAALEGSEYVLCYAGVREIRPDGALIRDALPRHRSGDMLDGQLRQFDINMVTPLMRHAVLARHGLCFDPHVVASEEYNLFIRLMAKGTVCAIPEVLGCWRISPGSLTDRSMPQWASERYYTIDQLLAENPGIEQRVPQALAIARARGHYYQAQYLMSLADKTGALAELRQAAAVDTSLRLLALTARVPPLWRLLHSTTMKRKWLPRLHRLVAGT
jgi:glycosyltransferase involved in cell wall biosynthesis